MSRDRETEGESERKTKMAAATEAKTVHSAAVTYFSMLSLLSLCPPFVILLWYTMVHADGSVAQTWNFLKQRGLQGLIEIWPKPTATAWKIIFIYGAFEAALQLFLPGKRVEGPISPTGNIPVYKGHVAPSSTDSGSSGNLIIDFYWGMELYPRIGKNFDIKVFTNCRFGLMSWAVLAVTYCIKQYEVNGKVSDSMLVNTTLMLVYVTKFFWWEAGYWNTMDIAHDRAGFYICWGCLVWVPSVYTSPGMYLVNHPVNLGTQLAVYILVAGILCIYINYDCDRQRQEFRRTNGKCKVWGKAPSKIEATYTTTSGETKTSLLLTSGWWGLSRHFHYVPEILAAFFWTVPALFNHFLPYFYVVFLTILLVDRAKRDDDRCRSKYGGKMSAYDNVVSGKLKLKGKALDVKAGGIKKKKKHKKQHQDFQSTQNDLSSASGGSKEVSVDPNEEDINDADKSSGEGKASHYDDHLTPAERRYIEQREQLDVHRLAKQANKSHRDRIQDFNQYLANMSEHYDIPKVGPG
ncbi:7-dehydrocholesterol reductase-like isoform X2 [Durio zibethinus]|uniref:7-dehydrocholesterol reductase n=1 Tax=Durio zibethinus TaxID=66656 RepID=A0A6P5WKF0_DURZI|nr:7-dehydrocholesterol reductase-like isoform X2 [Durio zibethinus]